MQSLKLAYRDVDRLPEIFAIRELAKRPRGLHRCAAKLSQAFKPAR